MDKIFIGEISKRAFEMKALSTEYIYILQKNTKIAEEKKIW